MTYKHWKSTEEFIKCNFTIIDKPIITFTYQQSNPNLYSNRKIIIKMKEIQNKWRYKPNYNYWNNSNHYDKSI